MVRIVRFLHQRSAVPLETWHFLLSGSETGGILGFVLCAIKRWPRLQGIWFEVVDALKIVTGTLH